MSDYSHLSLFSGIGGIDLAAEWAGFRTVAFVERDEFCQRVLAHHWPGVPIYGAIEALDDATVARLGPIDLLSGGFPCQPWSVAGQQLGAADDRHLWPQMRRVIAAAQPAWVCAENVPGIIGMGLDDVLSDLEALGYACGTLVLPACAVGAPHVRQRVFVVAHADGERQQQPSGPEREIWRWSGDSGEATVADADRAERRSATQRRDDADGHDARWHQAPSGLATCGSDGGEGHVADTNHEPWQRRSAGDRQSARRALWVSEHARGGGRAYDAGHWATEPGVGRLVDGVSDRLAQLRAFGNAVVPQQVAPILAAIAEQLRVAAEPGDTPPFDAAGGGDGGQGEG